MWCKWTSIMVGLRQIKKVSEYCHIVQIYEWVNGAGLIGL